MSYRVLLIQDGSADTFAIRNIVTAKGPGRFELECADRLSTGLERLAAGGVDLVLLDLVLPDSRGIETFVSTQAQVPQAPIVVLCDLEQEQVAVEAVQRGAQDYVIKGQIAEGKGALLLRVIRYAIERAQAQEELRRCRDQLEALLQDRCVEIAERKRTEASLQRRNRELALLNLVGQAFSSTFDLDWIFATVLEAVRHLMNVTMCSIWLLDMESDELVCQQAAGPQAEILRGWRLAAGEGLASWAVRHGKSLIMPDMQSDERHYKRIGQQTGLELHSLLSVPMQIKEDVIGVLQVADTEIGRFEAKDLELLEPLVASAAIAVENARLTRQAADAEILREVNCLRSELIANVSHELRTPLGLIKVFCNLLTEDIDLDGKTRLRFLHSIEEEADKLETIVSNLLNLNQLEGGRLILDCHPENMGQLVQAVIRDMQAQSDQHRLTWDFGDSLMAMVDMQQIEQVLRNLLSNAIKYAPDGGTIMVRGSKREGEVLVCVSDKGIGIPAREQERIFERFYRVESEVAQKVGGVGLGLSVCRGIIEAHGGRMWVESVSGVGSDFYFTLPAPPGQESPPATDLDQGDKI